MALTSLLLASATVTTSLGRAAMLGSLLLGGGASGPVEDPPPPPPAASAKPAKPPAPVRTDAPAKPAARKTWTAADLARLSGRGVSVAGAGEQAIPDPGATEDAATKAAPDVAGWAARAKSARAIIAAGEAQMAAIDEISAQWGTFVATTGANQAMAAHELAKLREDRKQWAEAVARASADLLYVEEAARKAGVAPGLLR